MKLQDYLNYFKSVSLALRVQIDTTSPALIALDAAHFLLDQHTQRNWIKFRQATAQNSPDLKNWSVVASPDEARKLSNHNLSGKTGRFKFLKEGKYHPLIETISK